MIPKYLKLLLVITLSVLLIICGSLFWPRFVYQEGITQLKLKNYKQASDYFKKAEQAMPGSISTWFARADLFRIYTNYGRALYHLGTRDWKENGLSITSYGLLVRAKLYLTKADNIAPLSYRNAYWLTRTEESLEKIYPWLYPKKKNPYNAYTYYQKALPLRPSGITVRYSYVKYLYYKGLNTQIPELVQYMMEINPSTYNSVKKEAFYNEALIPYIKQGLSQAVEKDILPRVALKALSTLNLSQNNVEQSIFYYKDLLAQKTSLNSSYDYIHLGSLYLKNDEKEKSFESFKKSLLISKNTNSDINRIYRLFKRDKRFEDFINFTIYIKESDLQIPNFDMTIAKCRMDMGEPELAKEVLIRVNDIEPHAPAHYLLAKIAQKEKNWDQMEIAIQKATRLDQDNPNYYYLFSQALNYQKKYVNAEEAATKAIQYVTKANPWYYNHRARIRWNQKNYKKAVSDWEKAFALKPGRSDFPYRIALAHERQGMFKQARAYIQKAIDLAPDNSKYKDLQTRLNTHK